MGIKLLYFVDRASYYDSW